MLLRLLLVVCTAAVCSGQCPLGSFGDVSNNSTCTVCPAESCLSSQQGCTECPVNSSPQNPALVYQEQLVGSCTSTDPTAPTCFSSVQVVIQKDSSVWREDPQLTVQVQITDFGSSSEYIEALTINDKEVSLDDSLIAQPHGDSACAIFLPIVDYPLETVAVSYGGREMQVLTDSESGLSIQLSTSPGVNCCPCDGLYLNAELWFSYIPKVRAVALEQCLCKAGYSGPDGGECVPCRQGTYKDTAGNATCLPCWQGTIQPLEGASTCTECPAQTFASPDQRECLSCPDGSISFPPSADKSSCVCKAGHEGPAGGPCSPCKVGTYKREVGPGECDSCPSGSCGKAARTVTARVTSR
eukprot:215597-Rhodomonas_salina.1